MATLWTLGSGARGHLAALHLRDPARRVQHDDGDRVAAPERLDRRGPGIARGGGEDRRRPPPLRQHRIQHPRHHLQREVLEGERRPVEQLLQPEVGPELDQRRGGGMVEAGVALRRDGLELRAREGPAGEARHDGGGHVRVRPAAQAFEGGGIQRRPALRQVEPAVRRGALEQGVLERDPPAPALPRADVAQAALSVLVRPVPDAARLYAPARGRQATGPRGPAGSTRATRGSAARAACGHGRSVTPPGRQLICLRFLAVHAGSCRSIAVFHLFAVLSGSCRSIPVYSGT